MLFFLRPHLKLEVFRQNSGSMPSGPERNVRKAGKMEGLALPSAAAGRDGVGLGPCECEEGGEDLSSHTLHRHCTPGHPDRRNCPA